MFNLVNENQINDLLERAKDIIFTTSDDSNYCEHVKYNLENSLYNLNLSRRTNDIKAELNELNYISLYVNTYLKNSSKVNYY